jgi:hypothetical protein
MIAYIPSLASCDANQLEIMQILRYNKGQQFQPHTDGFDCGFELGNFSGETGRVLTSLLAIVHQCNKIFRIAFVHNILRSMQLKKTHILMMICKVR